MHANGKEVECQLCDTKLESKFELSKHNEAIHDANIEENPDSKEKPFRCGVCKITFSRIHHVRGHIAALHDDRKPYKCSFCDSRFACKQVLPRHIAAVHERKKLFKCNVCDRSFDLECYLKKHKERNRHFHVPFVVLL